MNIELKQTADRIIREAIEAVLPDSAVKKAMNGMQFPGNVYLVAIGKAAWSMAAAAAEKLGERLTDGIVITKYGHVVREIPGVRCREAAHPVPDENGLRATAEVLEMTAALQPEDTVLFLVSGGGSALFEKPAIPLTELQDVTGQLLACGADITEINTIRKRLSLVKGGKFACHCAPARVCSIILSDIVGDPLDMIASGPAYPDASTAEDAVRIAEKYRLNLTAECWDELKKETPKSLDNTETHVTGSVRELCRAAAESCRKLGFEPYILTDCLGCEARDAGRFLASVARTHAADGRPTAFLAGGETVVHLTGNGKGGRNQEIALAAAEVLQGICGTALFSVGSDGTDGPTDAAGGYCDGDTWEEIREHGVDPSGALAENDAYHALKAASCLIVTGPTGTNVNDVTVVLTGAGKKQ